MKILHVINRLGTGGAEKLLTELLPLQQRRGHRVDVVRLASGTFEFAARLQEAGIRVTSLGRSERDIYNPFFVFRLIPHIRSYDVVHVHLFPSQYWVVGAKVLGRLSTPIVTTEHSTRNRRSGKWYWKPFDRWVYRRFDSVIAITDRTREQLSEQVGPLLRATVIPNGVDGQKFRDAEGYGKSLFTADPDAVLLLTLGRFSEAKDQDTVIRALRALPDRFHLLLAGDGVRRQSCERLAENLGVAGRTHFLGNRTDVPALLKTADALVMSSHWEGLSVAAIEGMAAGKPVVASDVPGLVESVGGAGILFPHADADRLAAEIAALFADPEYCRAVALRCAERAETYDIRTMCDRYLKVYESVIERNI